MKKLVNGLLYSLLIAVAAAGLAGVAHFAVQEKERAALWEEAERRLAQAEQEKANEDAQKEQASEDIRAVFVKNLPVYQEKKITKGKAGRVEMLSYGDEVTVLEEDGLYTKVRTRQESVGYVWSDCIGSSEGGQNLTPLQIVVLDVKLSGQDGEEAQEADALCLKLAADLEQRLEERGYAAVLTARAGEQENKEAKRTLLANQIQADARLQIALENDADGAADGGSEPAADSRAAVYCVAADSADPAVQWYADSKKLGKKILKYYTKQTGMENGGVLESGDGTSMNQSKMPAVTLKLGDFSASGQSGKMKKAKFQAKMVQGIADGIEAYFQAADAE
ncbi:MAG: N-acetylmuramoyl-L-alanine amidase [Eubacterium sp.]|nr:N-acetylmuramoyl-L-alanine amidase [Eubacterium sp.]